MKESVKFEDNRMEVKAALGRACIGWLHAAAGLVLSQTQRNTRVDTGQTKGSWEYRVDEEKLEAYVGSSYENAIWEEFGTGQYALEGGGRKTPWIYKGSDGKLHWTRGKRPSRALYKAFKSTKPKIKKALEQRLGGLK